MITLSQLVSYTSTLTIQMTDADLIKFRAGFNRAELEILVAEQLAGFVEDIVDDLISTMQTKEPGTEVAL